MSGYTYVGLNTVVSLLAFGRNLMFIKVFGLADVGQIALMQTIVMLVGFSQVGLISGAFILWAGGDRALNTAMAGVLFSGKLALAALITASLLIFGADALAPTVAPETLVVGLAAGLATLASNWLNNALVADQKLRQSNLINIVAVSLSLGLALVTIQAQDLRLALASIAVQPALVALGALLVERGVRPASLVPDRATVAKMLGVGVQPFLGSLAVLAIYQVERWSIALVLGPEALGRYYIVILYLTFFLLVPVALMNINIPKAIRAADAGDHDSFRQIRRRHMLELGLYALAALVTKLALLSPVLALLQFAGSEPLIYLAFLAGLAFIAQDIGTLVLYALRRTTPILVAGVVSLAGFVLAAAGLQLAGAFALETVVYARILASLCGLAILMLARGRALALHSAEGLKQKGMSS
jgi:O-antigen/teichoic acid export membrane protein